MHFRILAAGGFLCEDASIHLLSAPRETPSKSEERFVLSKVIDSSLHHLTDVKPMVQWPHCLEEINHSLFEFFWNLMKCEEILKVPHFGLVLRPSGVHPLYYGCHITKYHCVHQSWNIPCQWCSWTRSVPPINMIKMLKIFSELVLAETFPNPTEVKLEQVK